MNKDAISKFKELVSSNERILIIQADNPDGDSLGSALALEHMLHQIGKDPVLYCAVDVPKYLRYVEGWDRVVHTVPSRFDVSIIVDTGTMSLLEKAVQSGEFNVVAKKPVVVLDHHASVEHKIIDECMSESSLAIIDSSYSSTAEIIFTLTKKLELPLDREAGFYLMVGILGDTQGLSNELTQPSTYRAMAHLCDLGVDRPALEEKRRLTNKMKASIYRYKAQLISRTEIISNGAMALVCIPYHEIEEHSPLYNPAALIQPDMLQIDGVDIAIVIKQYDDGKMTCALRANHTAPIAAKIASHFGGGGHEFAAGFKTYDYSSCAVLSATIEHVFNQLKTDDSTNITNREA